MTYRRDLPVPKSLGTWTYWVSRDSINGELSGKCSLWRERPIRVRHRYRVTWVGTDDKNPGHLGEYRTDEIAAWFRVYPETDLELIRVEQGVTEKMLQHVKEK